MHITLPHSKTLLYKQLAQISSKSTVKYKLPSAFNSQSNVKFSQILSSVDSLNAYMFEQAEACNLHASTEVG